MTRISAHALSWNFRSFPKVNRKFKHFLLFFSIQSCTKGNHEILQNRSPALVRTALSNIKPTCFISHYIWTRCFSLRLHSVRLYLDQQMNKIQNRDIMKANILYSLIIIVIIILLLLIIAINNDVLHSTMLPYECNLWIRMKANKYNWQL